MKSIELFKRKGIVKVSKTLLNSMGVELMKPFFSEFYPIQINHKHDIIEYVCVSTFFAELNEDVKLPVYDVVFHIVNGEPTIKEVKLIA